MGEGECETKKESMIYFFLLENKSAFSICQESLNRKSEALMKKET